MATVVGLVQRKLGNLSGCFLGYKVTDDGDCMPGMGGRGPRLSPLPGGLAHSQGQVLIQQHKVAEVPGLLSLQKVANASTMEQSGGA